MSHLPERSTRGKRPNVTEAQHAEDDAFYERVFGAAARQETTVKSQPLHAIRGEKMLKNIRGFPYARMHHYFFDLETFPRVGNTSYAYDSSFEDLSWHFSNQKQLAEKGVLNRHYIGVPVRIPKPKIPTNDKNPCHDYLFRNEDRKWKLDQLLSELTYLDKHHQILFSLKARSFSLTRKQPDLGSLYDPNVPQQDKIFLLKAKIQALQNRRAQIKQQLETNDWLYFSPSLNQRLFGHRDDDQLNLPVVLSGCQFMFSNVISALGAMLPQDRIQKINLLFTVFDTTCGRGAQLPTSGAHFRKQLLMNFVVPPCYIYNFTHAQNLRRTREALAVRCFESLGVSKLDRFKDFWKSYFGEECTFSHKNHQIIETQQYSNQMRAILEQYTPIVEYPSSEEFVLPTRSHNQCYGSSPQQVQLDNRAFLLIYLVHYIYQRIGFFNINEYLIGSEQFTRCSFKAAEKVQYAFAASLDSALDKFAELVDAHIVDREDMPDLFWELTPVSFVGKDTQNSASNRTVVGLVWAKEKQVWETESEPEQEQEEQQNGDSGQSQSNEIDLSQSDPTPMKKVHKN